MQPQYTRVAFVVNNELVEFHIEHSKENKIVGNIYKGKVVNILTGMQAAFIDIGLNRNGYLYVGDMLVDNTDVSESVIPKELKLAAGDEIMTQVVKDEVGNKGARLTCNLSLPGRLLVAMPDMDYVGVSLKISSEERRGELAEFVEKIRPKNMGFIVRTASESATNEEIEADCNYLVNLHKRILEKYAKAKVKDCIHSEENLLNRTVRDLYKNDVNKIVVNNQEAYDEVSALLKNISQNGDEKIQLYQGKQDMFTFYKLNFQIDRLMERKVFLKNGAYLIFDYSEALTVIDVNTGKYTGDQNLEETVFYTNMLAAKEIARQLRLRNLGGIIIVDFIDMEQEEHRKRVLEVLKEYLKKDRIKCTLMGMTNLGLVEITRKKTRNLTASFMQTDCPYCEGEGKILSVEYTAIRIKAAIRNLFATIDASSVIVTVSTRVFASIMQKNIISFYDDAELSRKRIYLVEDSSFHAEQFTVKGEWESVLSLPENAKLLY